MTDLQYEQAGLIKDMLEAQLLKVVNDKLSSPKITREMAEHIRTLLTEQMRFWE